MSAIGLGRKQAIRGPDPGLFDLQQLGQREHFEIEAKRSQLVGGATAKGCASLDHERLQLTRRSRRLIMGIGVIEPYLLELGAE